MAHEYQNPTVPCNNGQQFPITPAQGLNVHVQIFAPTQSHAPAPLMSQLVIPPRIYAIFHQVSGLPRAPMLANVRPAKNGMAQGPVTAPAPGQQPLN